MNIQGLSSSRNYDSRRGITLETYKTKLLALYYTQCKMADNLKQSKVKTSQKMYF